MRGGRHGWSLLPLTNSQAIRVFGLTVFVWLWAPVLVPKGAPPMLIGVPSAFAHQMGFATGDLYLNGVVSGQATIELELVLDAPEGERGDATDTVSIAQRRSRLLDRIQSNLFFLQAGRSLSKRVRVLSLGQGPSAVDVVRVRADVVDIAQPLQVQSGAELDELVIKVHREGHNSVQELWVEPGGTSARLPFVSAATPTPSTVATSATTLDSGSEDQDSQEARPEQATRLPFGSAVRRGFAHILPLGFDHVVFILGLFFLATSVRMLVIELTLFTFAHSITLALGVLGWIKVAPSVAEPLIALSILLIGLEPRWVAWLRARTDTLPLGMSPFQLRALVIFAFGLLHGLGFASVFGRIGLTGYELARVLAGFNLGVELGQLVVVMGAITVFGPFRGRAWYAAAVVPTARACVALLGGLWFLERVLA